MSTLTVHVILSRRPRRPAPPVAIALDTALLLDGIQALRLACNGDFFARVAKYYDSAIRA
jgi:hypothetical protein